MIFDLSEGIKPRIEKALKTISTDREELKQESSQVESFGLKTVFFLFFFDWSKTGSINRDLKNQKILKT